MDQNWLQSLVPNYGGAPNIDQGQLNQALLIQNQPPPMPTAQPAMKPVSFAAPPPPPMQKRPLTALSKFIPQPVPGQSPESTGYSDLSKKALSDQASELSGLNDYINNIANKPRDINFTPLASFVDNLTGSKLAPAAQAMAPMSEDDRDKMLFGLKQQLAAGQARLSSSQLQALKEQQSIEQYARHQAELERHDQAMENKAAGGASAQELRAQTMMGNQALQQVSKIHDDGIIKQMRQQAVNIDKGQDLMAGPTVSNKTLAEVAQDFSAALSGKAAASDFKLKELMTDSLSQKLSNAIAFATNNPDQPAPPDVIKFWKHIGDRLQQSYDSQMGARAKGKLEGIKTAAQLNPMAYQAAKEAADLYQNGKWRILEGRPVPGSARPEGHPEDADAVRWAKSNSNDPRAAAILKANGL